MEKKFALTKEECLKIGGHCYDMDNKAVLTLPPIYHRICKHCGHKQQGILVAPVEWKDDND